MNTFDSSPWILRVALVGATVVLLSSGCNRRPAESEEGSEPAVSPVVPVRVARVQSGDAPVTILATGKTDALRKEKIFSPVAGRIVSLKALEGTPVRKGDVLATVRPKETQTAIAGAQALLKRARTPAQEEEARRALALAESTENSVDVHASFDGIVSTRAVAEGELVGENAELFSLVDLSSLEFFADVPLSALASVRPGETAEIRFAGLQDRTFLGRVETLSPQSDPQSQTVRARIRFAGAVSGLLRTEMAGTARIVSAVHRNALLVPRSALLHDDEHDTYSVVTVTADSIARVVPVSVGSATDSTAEITGGPLRAGMFVVTEGNYSLADSTRVSIAGDGNP